MIDRYGVEAVGYWEHYLDDEGDYVLYEDHLAAVAEAEQRAWDDMVGATRWTQGAALFMTSRDIDRLYRLAAAVERARIRKAVESLMDENGGYLVPFFDLWPVIDNEEDE